MFAFVEGEPVGNGPDFVVVSVSGLGFRIFVPPTRVDEISGKPFVRLHTHLAVREDGMTLFGLQTEVELAVFRQLISVSGIGPRLALAVLSTWNIDQLKQIVAQEDVNSLTSVPGIGRKTAQRLLLELKDKITSGGEAVDSSVGMVADAEAALTALGYRSAEVRPVVRALARDAANVQDLIRMALTRLTRGEK